VPIKDGLTVLEWIKIQKQLERIPVIMLTGCNAPENEQRAAHLGATSFLIKGYDLDQMIALATQIKENWIIQEMI
jgi:CheY-like chemotaxis protein